MRGVKAAIFVFLIEKGKKIVCFCLTIKCPRICFTRDEPAKSYTLENYVNNSRGWTSVFSI